MVIKMRKFKIGDIIVRIYKNERKAIGMFDSCDVFIYLGENFYDDGGLHKFGRYGIAYDSYNYRLATLSETNDLLDSLNKCNYSYEHFKYFGKVIQYRDSFRKVKLLNLNKINDI